jgi:hypothetical protein
MTLSSKARVPFDGFNAWIERSNPIRNMDVHIFMCFHYIV